MTPLFKAIFYFYLVLVVIFTNHSTARKRVKLRKVRQPRKKTSQGIQKNHLKNGSNSIWLLMLMKLTGMYW